MPVSTTRRPHAKSRLGCAQCKARRVKCDQAAPACSACVRRKQVCSLTEVHLHIARSNGNTVETTPSQSSLGSPRNRSYSSSAIQSCPTLFSSIDLELTHFYATQTCSTLMLRPQAAALWKDDLFDMALEHPAFLDALLATAAMHKLVLGVCSAKHDAYTEFVKRKGSQLIPYLLSMLESPSEENCVLLFASSILLTIWAFASVHLPLDANLFAASSFPGSDASSCQNAERQLSGRRTPKLDDLLTAINISSGTRVVAKDMAYAVKKRGFAALVASPDYNILPPVPADIHTALDCLSVHWKATVSSFQRAEIYQLQTDRLHEIFRVAQCPEWHDMIFGFAARFTKDMICLLEQKDPCALVIVAYWTALLRGVEGVCWWLKAWSKELYTEIKSMLDVEWRAHLEVLSIYFT
ncbi:uncharacterized protein PV09_07017 [Verruconis gallopava]|uniref:Zn(2)-C6 fungal-type domain-containing protein n=1 Tax=Verruconis gallopava TaxID=253628 RepID=A0A0D2AQV2_9PEZI|nr:uncharacterized protein PV09_07017 [Verruconis gallopava]KIW01539.1 hypothetical protein PV09_07017 [Verruconis gallopava]